MPFGWLKPEKEPKNSHLVEISNDEGDHVVVDVPTKKDAKAVEKIVKDVSDAVTDTDDAIYRQTNFAQKQYKKRDHEQLRVRSEKVVDKDEDLEAEVDDDSIVERDENPAEGGWWPF